MGGFAWERPLDSSTPALIVDARGHRCPVPTLRLRRALDQVSPGQRVLLLADDPMARIDVPHFAGETGHRLIEAAETDGGFAFTVERRGAALRS